MASKEKEFEHESYGCLKPIKRCRICLNETASLTAGSPNTGRTTFSKQLQSSCSALWNSLGNAVKHSAALSNPRALGWCHWESSAVLVLANNRGGVIAIVSGNTWQERKLKGTAGSIILMTFSCSLLKAPASKDASVNVESRSKMSKKPTCFHMEARWGAVGCTAWQ